jgi:hypothetical protein
VILHQQLYDQTIELVRGVYAYLEESDKYNMMLILTNVKANVEGMKNDEINEENCIRLLARVIHQISYIHSIDHFYLHYTLRDKKINMFYGNILQDADKSLVHLFNSFVYDIAFSPNFNLMTDLKFKCRSLNKLYQSYLRKTEYVVNNFKYNMNGKHISVSNSDISFTLSY